ncbi:CGNR zinc finger domain-containing protein [Nonomuraea sp. SBT364]|uniref:CGNR zinc finger domain-containing protein n=1 Tax=Nonomuraea sp. SBT364 TaxID=1580530 RepID=UPI001E2A86B7|nr:CGNR zinc finger domain-containing protein [Nonomuraea sp. SBT364]
MTIEAWRITGQSQIDSYVGRWVELAVVLVNTLVITQARGRPVEPPESGAERLTALTAAVTEPAGRPREAGDADALAAVAEGLHPVFTAAPGAVEELNAMLVRHGAVPCLYGEPPMLSFHARDAGTVDAWAASMGTALAMVIGVGQGVRLRSCEAAGCDLVFFDVTRNASRRFCGLSCQNRAKATAYRARRRA